MSERLLASLQSAIAELDDNDRNRLLANLAHNRKGMRELSRDQMAVWEALRAASIGITPPIDRFLETYGRARYEEKVAEIFEFLRDTWSRSMRAFRQPRCSPIYPRSPMRSIARIRGMPRPGCCITLSPRHKFFSENPKNMACVY